MPFEENSLPRDLVDMLSRHVERQPDAVVVRFDDLPTTYGQLFDASLQVASALVATGVRAQERVAVLARNCLETVEVVFGVAQVNAVTISVNWRLHRQEIVDILDDAGARTLVISSEFEDVAEHAVSRGMSVIVFGDDNRLPAGARAYSSWKRSGPSGFVHTPAGQDDIVTQLYTSGTTGRPKGVLSANRGFMLYLDLLSGVTGFGDDSVSLCTLPFFHIGGLGWLLAGVYGGAETVVLQDADVARTLDAINRHHVTEMFAVPTVIQRMVQSPLIDTLETESLRTLYYGTGPITVPILTQAIRVFGCNLVQGFGMTEIGLMMCCLLRHISQIPAF